MGWLEAIHERRVRSRRVRRLAAHLAPLLPERASVLDVGCGDGALTARLASLRPDATIRGVDVKVRPDTVVPVEPFDGRCLPSPDESFDVVLFVDVLHHTDEPDVLLEEARRVARRSVLLKDHTRDGILAAATLRFMDRVGNRRHDVALPHDYRSEAEWRSAFERAGLRVRDWLPRLGIYPFPASLLFDRRLHFVALLEKE